MSEFILVDVDGTLILPESKRPAFSTSWLAHFRAQVTGLAEIGFRVGLCSDSPLLQLQKFGEQIGFGLQGHFPILAENGNVFAFEDEVSILQPSRGLSSLRSTIELLAIRAGLRRLTDVAAPEFGSGAIPINANQWAYGANRLASLSVFAPRSFIVDAGREIVEWSQAHSLELDIDCSPGDNFLVAHPYRPMHTGKGLALAALSRTSNIVMIGNSRASWVDPATNVRCAFVGGADLPTSIRSPTWYMSDQHSTTGSSMYSLTSVRQANTGFYGK